MKIQFLISVITFFALSAAYQISEGVIKSNGRELTFSQDEETTVPIVFNDTNSKLDIFFKIIGTKQPDQVFIKIVNEDNVETSLKPIIKSTSENDGYNAKTSIIFTKLPSLFKISPLLKIKLIIAGFKDSNPIFTTISSIELTQDLISKNLQNYEKPQRFGKLPEIHHIFQNPPTYVNSGIALIFSTISIITLLGLISVWISLGLVNLKNFPTGNIFQHFIFIGLIISYEFVFFQYYLGSTIFQTIAKVVVLLGPTVFFGSKVLNYVGSLRLAGKR